MVEEDGWHMYLFFSPVPVSSIQRFAKKHGIPDEAIRIVTDTSVWVDWTRHSVMRSPTP